MAIRDAGRRVWVCMKSSAEIRSTAISRMAWFVLTAVLVGLVSCQSPATSNASSSDSPSAGTSSTAGEVSSRVNDGPSRDLSQDERAGGHILRKHVGQTEEQLRQRLEREPNITGASTYTDRATAERAVATAIAQSRKEIDSWLNRSGRHPNLVLDYDSDSPIGRTMNRGEHQSRVCQHSVVVLKYDGPDHDHVLTSYPECRS